MYSVHECVYAQEYATLLYIIQREAKIVAP